MKSPDGRSSELPRGEIRVGARQGAPGAEGGAARGQVRTTVVKDVEIR
jgi:hypothetical protein